MNTKSLKSGMKENEMPKFLITRTYKHTEELEIEADSEVEALELAEDMEFDRNYDDWLYDEKVKEI